MIRNGTLETVRLVVRPFREADAPALVESFADPLVARHVGDGRGLDPATAALWIRRSHENIATHGHGTGAVILRETRAFIGWAGIARPQGLPEEIIFGLRRAFWGRGLGKELTAAVADFAESQGINPVRATVDRPNIASAKLLMRCGFVRAPNDGTVDEDVDLFLRRRG